MNDTLIKTAIENGFDKCEIIKTAEIPFDFSLRKYCEDNVCGNYGNNYACPPDCGEPEQMYNKVMEYSYAAVMQKSFTVKSFTEPSDISKCQNSIQQVMKGTVKTFNTFGIIGSSSMPGGCRECTKCQKINNKPCVNPSAIAPCVSAYCIDMQALCQKCGMDYFSENNQISFFCIYFFN